MPNTRDKFFSQTGDKIQQLLNAIQPPFQTTQPVGGMLPNIMYNFGELSGDTTFLMAAPADNTIVNHYFWMFDTPSTAPTITWPAAITMWADGNAPTIGESTHYEVSVINGVAAIMAVELPTQSVGE